jgi:EAL domain-containing protein (putative c-di-GMP-specific phosphodiesterase class I)
MLDPARAMETMQRLSEMGVVLSIDDFGTGYTSISQLKNLPVHEIKIDKSFVINMFEDPGDELTVKSIIDLAHTMGYLVVAEGVETEAAMQAMVEKGCDMAQGFYLGKPMPIAAFDRSLMQKRWKLA